MIIYQSVVKERNNETYLEAQFQSKEEKKTLWFKIPAEYKAYIVTENQDAALVSLLVLAMINNENIHIKGKVSAKLFYTINTYLIKAFHLANKEYHIIRVTADSLNYDSLVNTKNAATGLSCGIDSFSTISTHLNLDKEYKIKYFMFLNAGSHGKYGSGSTQKTFLKRLDNIKKYSLSVNIPILQIESNISEHLNLKFQKLHSVFQLSCVLVLQKLINIYYYSSAYRFDYFQISKDDTSSWDTLLIQYLQTESTGFYSSMAQMTRLERTKLVARYEPTYQFLDVCVNPLISNKNNCSKCDKCLRTLISFDLEGLKENYKEVFDFEVYNKHKDKFISSLIFKKEKDQINLELLNALKAKNKIRFKHYYIYLIFIFKKRIKKKLRVFISN